MNLSPEIIGFFGAIAVAAIARFIDRIVRSKKDITDEQVYNDFVQIAREHKFPIQPPKPIVDILRELYTVPVKIAPIKRKSKAKAKPTPGNKNAAEAIYGANKPMSHIHSCFNCGGLVECFCSFPVLTERDNRIEGFIFCKACELIPLKYTPLFEHKINDKTR